MGRKPRLLYWDLEISKTQYLVENYGPKIARKYFKDTELVRERTILSASWRYHGDSFKTTVSTKPEDPFNDIGVVHALYPHIADADVLIGHNGDNFDLKEFMGRCLKHGLPPFYKPPKETVDTLKIARKFRIDHRGLRGLANFLGLDIQKEDFDDRDWRDVHKGCPEAFRKMRSYNGMDVMLLEPVYERLRGWDHRHPDLSVIADIKDTAGDPVPVCKVCLSHNTVLNGHYFNRKRTKKKQKILCNDCGSTFLFGDYKSNIENDSCKYHAGI